MDSPNVIVPQITLKTFGGDVEVKFTSGTVEQVLEALERFSSDATIKLYGRAPNRLFTFRKRFESLRTRKEFIAAGSLYLSQDCLSALIRAWPYRGIVRHYGLDTMQVHLPLRILAHVPVKRLWPQLGTSVTAETGRSR